MPFSSVIMIWLTILSLASVARAPAATLAALSAAEIALTAAAIEPCPGRAPQSTTRPLRPSARGRDAPSSAICACVSGLSSAISDSARAAASRPRLGSTSHLTNAETAPALAISRAAPACSASCASVAAALLGVGVAVEQQHERVDALGVLIMDAFWPIGASPEARWPHAPWPCPTACPP